MNRRLFTALGATALLVAALMPAAAGAASPVSTGSHRFTKAGNYIVQLADKPVVAYGGGIKGLAATKPAAGKKVDQASAAVLGYTRYLTGRHDAKLKAAGGGKKLYDYAFSFNGFAARLTAAEANRLATDKDVLSVSPDELHKMDTSSTPAFLGLSDPGGLWAQLGGVGKAGEDIVIGDIDSGIWPEALSFSDRIGKNPAGSGLTYKKPVGWHGTCQTGEDWNKHDCNNKLIGARYYNTGLGGNAAIDALPPRPVL